MSANVRGDSPSRIVGCSPLALHETELFHPARAPTARLWRRRRGRCRLWQSLWRRSAIWADWRLRAHTAPQKLAARIDAVAVAENQHGTNHDRTLDNDPCAIAVHPRHAARLRTGG